MISFYLAPTGSADYQGIGVCILMKEANDVYRRITIDNELTVRVEVLSKTVRMFRLDDRTNISRQIPSMPNLITI